jgi:hypothetical protein
MTHLITEIKDHVVLRFKYIRLSDLKYICGGIVKFMPYYSWIAPFLKL